MFGRLKDWRRIATRYTLVLPHEEMARWAVERLLDSDETADAGPSARRIKIERQLVTRGPVSAPPLRRVRLG